MQRNGEGRTSRPQVEWVVDDEPLAPQGSLRPPRSHRVRLLVSAAAVIAVPVAAVALAGSLPTGELADGFAATDVSTNTTPLSTVATGREAVSEPRRPSDPKGVAVVVPPTTTTTVTPSPTTTQVPAPAAEAAPPSTTTTTTEPPQPVSVPATTVAPAPAPAPRPAHHTPRPDPAAGSVSANLDAIAQCESGGNPDAYNPAGYYGAFQFSLATWHGLGMSGDPRDYTYNQQKYVAYALYNSSGYSAWPSCARSLGLI